MGMLLKRHKPGYRPGPEPEPEPEPVEEGPEEVEEPEAEGYADYTREELEAIAEERDVEVVRRDGGEGAPLKSDYIAALGDA